MLAQELEGISHVRVNTLNPGRTRTAMRRQAYPAEDVETAAAAGEPHRRLSWAAGTGQPRHHRQSFDAQFPLPPAGGRRQQRGQLLLSQLAELAAPERALQRSGPRACAARG